MRARNTTPDTCPGINRFVRPTMSYVKCNACGGDVELWSDEDVGTCTVCGAEWRRPEQDASCLYYCEYAEKCRALIRTRAAAANRD